MTEHQQLGELIEGFVNAVSHPRGRVLKYMTETSVTVPQAILINLVDQHSGSTPSSLAEKMQISLPSASQMIERLVKLGFLQRTEEAEDRRRKSIATTRTARTFLRKLKSLRSAEYSAGTARLSETTRRRLAQVLSDVMTELNAVEQGSHHAKTK